MRLPHEGDPELMDLVRRYIVVDRRHRRLGGTLLRLDGPERARFAHELAVATDEITSHQLGVLLEAGWRERKTAACLIAIAGRTEFRDRLGELLLANEVCSASQGYGVALAAFGTAADADLLTASLDRYLRRPDLSELFISEKTVEAHLRKSFAKLGISSRVMPAAAVHGDHVPRP